MSNKHKLPKVKFAKVVDTQSYGDMFSELVEKQLLTNIKEGNIIEATVKSIDSEGIVVDPKLKTEYKIPIEEFMLVPGEDLPKVGDKIEVVIERLEDRRGSIVLSRKKIITAQAWRALKEAYKKDEVVEGVIFQKSKGGLVVDLSGVIAFLPGGQVDIMPVRDVDHLIGKVLKFKILKMDEAHENVVISRKAVIELSRSEEKEKVLAQIHEGMIMDGRVKNITDYGAFIDLGSVDGLLHITDISWKRINHPSEELYLGQELKVKVIKFDPISKKIHLGLRQLSKSPWENIDSKYNAKDKIIGKVINLNDYNVFVEVEEGIEAVIPSGEISWSKADMNPRKHFIIGQEVECLIDSIDKDSSKMFLSLKKLIENPWHKFSTTHNVGDTFAGKIRNIIEFAMFVDIGNGIDGMIHESDISWEGNGLELIKNYKKGQEIEAKITFVDPEKEKVFLSIKHLSEDPYAKYYDKYKIGDVVDCKVTGSKNDYQLTVSIEEVLRGLIKRYDLGMDKSDQRIEKFKVGDTITAKIIGIDRNQNVINLSVKDYEIDSLEEIKKKMDYANKSSENKSVGNLIEQAFNKSMSDN